MRQTSSDDKIFPGSGDARFQPRSVRRLSRQKSKLREPCFAGSLKKLFVVEEQIVQRIQIEEIIEFEPPENAHEIQKFHSAGANEIRMFHSEVFETQFTAPAAASRVCGA